MRRKVFVGIMDKFMSTYVNRMDAKGRVSVPAAFRSILARDGYEGVFMTPAPQVQALEAGGNVLISKISALAEGFDEYSDELLDFSIALYGESQTLKLDGDGRVVLPEAFIDYAELKDAVSFVGVGDKFMLWNPQTFEERRKAAISRSDRAQLAKQAAAKKSTRDTRE